MAEDNSAAPFDMFAGTPPFSSRLSQLMTERSFANPSIIYAALVAGVSADALEVAAILTSHRCEGKSASASLEEDQIGIVDISKALKYVIRTLDDRTDEELGELVDKVLTNIVQREEDLLENPSAALEGILAFCGHNNDTNEEEEEDEEEEEEEIDEQQFALHVQETIDTWDAWEPSDPVLSSLKHSFAATMDKTVAELDLQREFNEI